MRTFSLIKVAILSLFIQGCVATSVQEESSVEDPSIERTGNTATIEWSATENVDKIKIIWREGDVVPESCDTNDPSVIVDASLSRFEVDSLDSDKEYSFRICFKSKDEEQFETVPEGEVPASESSTDGSSSSGSDGGSSGSSDGSSGSDSGSSGSSDGSSGSDSGSSGSSDSSSGSDGGSSGSSDGSSGSDGGSSGSGDGSSGSDGGSDGGSGGAPSAELIAPIFVGYEDMGSATITVRLDSTHGSDIDIDYATSNGSAVAGSDYTATSGTLTITAGLTEGTFSIPLTPDANTEGTESFVIQLSNPDPASVAFTRSRAVFSLYDNETGNMRYVRKTGSNSNNGNSSGTSWLTLGHAASNISAGDVVFVGAGTYSEAISLSVSGTSGAKIHFVADMGGTVTGDDGDVIVDGGGSTVFSLVSSNYVSIEGFNIRSSGGDGIDTEGSNGDGFEFRGNVFSSIASGIIIRDTDTSVAESNIFNGLTDDAIKVRDGSNNKVINNLIYDGTSTGIVVRDGPNTEVSFNTLINNSVSQVNVRDSSSGTSIRHNIIIDGDIGIHVEDGNNPANDYNVVYNNTTNYSGDSAGANSLTTDPSVSVAGDGTYKVSDSSNTLDAGSANASTFSLESGIYLDDLSSRVDDVLDGSGVDGATVNIGFHQ